MKILSSIKCGDMTVLYLQADKQAHLEMQLIPSTMMVPYRATKRRKFLGGSVEIDGLPHGWSKSMRADWPDSLIQYKALGEVNASGFAGGLTMRNSASVASLQYVRQEVKKADGQTSIITHFSSLGGLQFEHIVTWNKDEKGVRIRTLCINAGTSPQTLEMISSFSLGGLTPFDEADACGRLVFHRYRSYWSAEGRLESLPIENLHLERSWTGHNHVSERFGQVGSLPVRKYFPFAAVEDIESGVTWAAQLAHPGSWQMELYRRGDSLALSGGLADREFGHWMKTIEPGECLLTPEATLTVVRGGLPEAAQRLTAMQNRALDSLPPAEKDLPIIFNEWCSSWGNPTHDSLLAIADQLRSTPVKYLVIDDGWAEREGAGIQQNGDWKLDRNKFPHGMAATCEAIRERGLIPGIWFEFEVCTIGSKAYRQTTHLLHRDGAVLEVGERRFWDFRDPWVHEYLFQKVIRFLQKFRFGYLKVDYNDTIGLGCDGAESLGEGLRQHLEGVQKFFQRLREEIPDLVIENCSSGGHRLEPSMQGLCAMGSMSDAHETVEIPIIAANLHHLILPRQSQIWAVLRKTDAPQRVRYSLAATFLGRMVLSGDLDQLSPQHLVILNDAMALYRQVTPIIRDGYSLIHGTVQKSFRHPEGWQAVVRWTASDVLIVLHSFARHSGQISIPLPAGRWTKAGDLKRKGAKVELGKNRLHFEGIGPWTGSVVWLKTR